jgi:antitoxin YobK
VLVSVDLVTQAIEVVRLDESGSCWFVGERSEDLVLAAEVALGHQLPASYRLFVKLLGAGNVGSEEIYGVTSPDFVTSSVPNGIWLTW